MIKDNNSKLKKDIIQQMYNSNFLCDKGHNIIWTGTQKLYLSNLKCDKCGELNTNLNPLRWTCEDCQIFFCAICYKILSDKYCPKKHRLKFSKQNTVDFFSNYTCDYCFKKYDTKDGVLYDKDCNLTFCPKCYYDSCDIPDIIED